MTDFKSGPGQILIIPSEDVFDESAGAERRTLLATGLTPTPIDRLYCAPDLDVSG